MTFFLTKIFVSALVIAIVTEVAKLSDKWGGLIAFADLTFLILLWMHLKVQAMRKSPAVSLHHVFRAADPAAVFRAALHHQQIRILAGFCRQHFADRPFGLSVQSALRAVWREYTLA